MRRPSHAASVSCGALPLRGCPSKQWGSPLAERSRPVAVRRQPPPLQPFSRQRLSSRSPVSSIGGYPFFPRRRAAALAAAMRPRSVVGGCTPRLSRQAPARDTPPPPLSPPVQPPASPAQHRKFHLAAASCRHATHAASPTCGLHQQPTPSSCRRLKPAADACSTAGDCSRLARTTCGVHQLRPCLQGRRRRQRPHHSPQLQTRCQAGAVDPPAALRR